MYISPKRQSPFSSVYERKKKRKVQPWHAMMHEEKTKGNSIGDHAYE